MGDKIGPRILAKPSLSQNDDGSKLTITCEVEASPTLDIRWFKDNNELFDSDR